MDVAGFVETRGKLHEACEAIGRDPSEIMTSQHLRYDPTAGPGPLAAAAAERAEVGLDLAIVYLPPRTIRRCSLPWPRCSPPSTDVRHGTVAESRR